MRTGVVILPDAALPAALGRWTEAEARGFDSVWTYDHLAWRSLRDGPWFGALPLLAAAAGSTSTIRLGTLVTSPNFRHPALLAKDAMTLDHLSGGRFDLGVGAGGTGFDAEVLGGPAPSPAERADRFEEFVAALDVLLRRPAASFAGRHFTVHESRTYPGCLQRPRVPFTVAAAGPRAMAVAAAYGQSWVTYGPLADGGSAEGWFAGVADQVRALEAACERIGRDPSTIGRRVLVGLDVGWPVRSVAAWDACCARLADIGCTEVVVHWPRPDDPALPGVPPDVFDEISDRLR